jgi:DNA-binding CsgD family transcriptional regulator
VVLISKAYESDLADIFNRFFECQFINSFSHSRVYLDGSRSEVWSDSEAMKHTYLVKKYTTSVSHAPDVHSDTNKYFFLSDRVESIKNEEIRSNYVREMSDQREFFNHDNTFVVSFPGKYYNDYYCFYGPNGNTGTRIFIINNLDCFDRFIKYYNVAAKEIINKANNERIVKPRFKNKDLGRVLTKQEKSVAMAIVNLATYKDVAESLNLSIRTVQSYSETLKAKYNVFNKKDLITKVMADYKIFNSKL